MSPVRCPDCEKNVAIEISEAEITDTSFDDSELVVIVEGHIVLMCSECNTDLGEADATSSEIVPKMEEYLENHEDADPGEAEVEEAEITESKTITRNGKKTYISKWKTNVKLGRKTFKVNGDLAVTHEDITIW